MAILASARGLKCLNILELLTDKVDMQQLEQNQQLKLPWKNDVLLEIENDADFAFNLDL